MKELLASMANRKGRVDQNLLRALEEYEHREIYTDEINPDPSPWGAEWECVFRQGTLVVYRLLRTHSKRK